MLIRYYLTSIIIWVLMILVWQPLWALLPAMLIIILTIGSFQAHQTSIQSLQQFTTDNIMVLSWIALMVWACWMMYLVWQPLIISMIRISLITIMAYLIALGCNYVDGSIVWKQASIISIVAIVCSILVMIIQQPDLLQQYTAIITIYFSVVWAILVWYWTICEIRWYSLPSHLRSETILIWTILVPTLVIYTVCWDNLITSSVITMFLYAWYTWWIGQLSRYHYPITNQQELTLDLILKWYKTTHLSYLTRFSWVNTIFDHIQQLSYPTRTIIQYIPSIVMLSAFGYFVIHMVNWGILMIDFVGYCCTFLLYVSLKYIDQLSDQTLQLDTIPQSFIFWYLTIVILMISSFGWDPITGSIVGILWIAINALVVTQYQRLHLWQYLQPTHVKRRVRANTAGACTMIIVLVQLPIDGMMMIPLVLIVMSMLGFTIAQSYITLRSLTK